jgi:hypothetical protein
MGVESLKEEVEKGGTYSTHGEMRNAYRNFVELSKEKRSLQITRQGLTTASENRGVFTVHFNP